MNRTLVFGSTGFLGRTFFARPGPWLPVPRGRYDFTKPITDEFLDFLRSSEARHAVIAAAMASPDDCLREPALSEQINCTGTIALFAALKQCKIKPVFISTDHVFNGVEGLYREDEPYSPVTLYGRQKARAERHLRQYHSDHLILRTSKQVALRVDKKNLLSELAGQLRAGYSIRCATDSWLTPIFVEDVVAMIARALEADLCGVFHMAPVNMLTRHELGQAIARSVEASPDLVETCLMSEFGFPEVRPPRCTLNGTKLRELLDFKTIEIEDGLSRLQVPN